MTEPIDYTLAIEAGLYAGTAQDLPAGTYAIGGSIEADMVLIGEGLAPRHAIVAVDGDEARIEALADGVSVAGSGPLKVNRTVTVLLPCEISIVGVEICLSRTVSGRDAAPSSASGFRFFAGGLLRPAAALGIGAAVVALIASNLVAGAYGSNGSFSVEPLKPARTMVSTAAPGAATPEFKTQLRAPSSSLVQGAADELRREVEKAGLLNVAIGASDGAVTALGMVEPAAAGRWQNVQQWFDEHSKGEIALVNSVAVKAEKVPSSLGIEAVWRGPQSHLVIHGQKYMEGAVLDDGWTIQHIEAERVVLKRDGRLVAVRY